MERIVNNATDIIEYLIISAFLFFSEYRAETVRARINASQADLLKVRKNEVVSNKIINTIKANVSILLFNTIKIVSISEITRYPPNIFGCGNAP